MKNTVLKSRLSALALAGLAAGFAASPLHAGDAGSGTKTEKKGCNGKSSCKGMAHDSAAASEDRSCSGTGHCGGTTDAAGAKVDSASPKAKLLSAKTEKEFKAAAKKVEKTSCKGMNSCAGIYFHEGKATEISCKGKASCHGLKAVL
jgi:hypothetical protein